MSRIVAVKLFRNVIEPSLPHLLARFEPVVERETIRSQFAPLFLGIESPCAGTAQSRDCGCEFLGKAKFL